MRNACRKDESRGGIRQCANSLYYFFPLTTIFILTVMCGKWETYPREFAKCRRCRKAKYCGKECQSTTQHYFFPGWALDPEINIGRQLRQFKVI
jgi:hypothetical protein